MPSFIIKQYEDDLEYRVIEQLEGDNTRQHCILESLDAAMRYVTGYQNGYKAAFMQFNSDKADCD